MSQNFSFVKKKILLTGATRGIGRALVPLLLERGAHILAVARSEADLMDLQTLAPAQISILAADLRQPDLVAAVAHWVRAEHPDCTGLINNAAIMLHPDLFATDTDEFAGFDDEIAINLAAPVKLCTGLLPILTRHQSFILNVTSGLAISPKASAPVYCATKAALRSFTKTLRYQCEDAKAPILVSEGIMALVDTSLSRGDPSKKMRPKAAAEELLRGIENGKKEIWIERAKMLRVLHRVAPSLADRVLRDGL